MKKNAPTPAASFGVSCASIPERHFRDTISILFTAPSPAASIPPRVVSCAVWGGLVQKSTARFLLTVLFGVGWLKSHQSGLCSLDAVGLCLVAVLLFGRCNLQRLGFLSL